MWQVQRACRKHILLSLQHSHTAGTKTLVSNSAAQYQPKDVQLPCGRWGHTQAMLVLRPMSLSLLFSLPAVQSINCSPVPSPSSCRLFQLLNDLRVYSVCLDLPKGLNSSTLPAALHKNSINSPLTSSSLPASSSCSWKSIRWQGSGGAHL